VRYLLIHYIDESILSWGEDGHELPDPEADRALEAWDAEMITRAILTGGGALRPVGETKTLHVRGGELVVTDGPFAETKEQIAGYSVLECASLDEAIEVCSRHPTAKIGTFELRPFQQPEEAEPAESAESAEAAEAEVIPADPPGAEKQALLHFLDYQRASVLSTVAGLDEEAWHRPVVPSGWTPAGLVEHLGDAERHWFQRVITGTGTDLPWDEGRPPYDPQAAFVCDRPAADVIAYYREQCERSNAVLAAAPLSARPRGRHGDPDVAEPKDVRTVVLHMIEETACHAGHLDIARELLDGRTGLGLR
jgi:uncharacterized damage-inducible protein DinB